MIYKVIFNISFFQPWFRQFKRYCCCFQSDKWKPKKSFVSPAQCNSFTQLKSKGWWTTKCAENMTFIYRLMFYLSRRVMWTFWPGPRQRTSGQEKQWIKHSMNSLSFFLILSLWSDIRQSPVPGSHLKFYWISRGDSVLSQPVSAATTSCPGWSSQ